MVKTKIKELLLKGETITFLIIVVLCVLFGILNPAFYAWENIFTLLKNMVMPGIFACGVMTVLINGGLDMSFMWIGMFGAYATTKMFAYFQNYGGWTDIPLVLIFVTSIVISALLGSFNAFIISTFDIPVFVGTLASANVFMGIMLQFVGDEYVFASSMPVAQAAWSRITVFNGLTESGSGMHVSIFVMLAAMVVNHFVLKYTTIGRSVYALGGDLSSAERVGIKLNKVRYFIYMYAGAWAGLSSIVYVSNIESANPYDFQGRELSVTSAVILGGTKITGGAGNMFGVFLGLALSTIITRSLILIGLPTEYQKFVYGLLLLFAVAVQSIQEKIKATMK